MSINKPAIRIFYPCTFVLYDIYLPLFVPVAFAREVITVVISYLDMLPFGGRPRITTIQIAL
jgi:hypothetical protein